MTRDVLRKSCWKHEIRTRRNRITGRTVYSDFPEYPEPGHTCVSGAAKFIDDRDRLIGRLPERVTDYVVIRLNGQVMKTGMPDAAEFDVHTECLLPGIYEDRIRTEADVVCRKFMKR